MTAPTPPTVEPLPPPSCLPEINGAPELRGAYLRLFTMLERLSTAFEPSPINELRLLNIKILGFLILDLWKSRPALGSKPAQQVISEVIHAANDEAIIALGKWYQENLIQYFRRKGSLPDEYNNATPPHFKFDSLQDMLDDRIAANPSTHHGARKFALARDNFRCLATGRYDLPSIEKLPEQELEWESAGIDYTECCHIIGEATAKDIQEHSNDLDRRGLCTLQSYRDTTPTILGILSLFGFSDIHELLLHSEAHHLWNILTVSVAAHRCFDALRLWFESTDVAHQYTVCCYPDLCYQMLRIKPGTVVTFTVNPTIASHATKNTPEVSLPDPRLLALHATCCRVAHISGAAAYFDQLDREMEDALVLEEEMSSNAVNKTD